MTQTKIISELNYWRETHSPLYSFIFTLPLFLIYEIGIFAISASDLPLLRNGADVLMRQILEIFGVFGVYGFSGTFLDWLYSCVSSSKKEFNVINYTW